MTKDEFRAYAAKWKANWLSQGKCPYCAEHKALYTKIYCYTCREKFSILHGIRRREKERKERLLEQDVDKYISGITVKGDWPRKVYFAELVKHRCEGTRFDAILTALERGAPVKDIAERFNCDERTVKVYRKVIRGTISGVKV